VQKKDTVEDAVSKLDTKVISKVATQDEEKDRAGSDEEDAAAMVKEGVAASSFKSPSQGTNDDQPCYGFVCGKPHSPSAGVYWILYEGCNAWYEVVTNCVGF
jgi:hypothetical protein